MKDKADNQVRQTLKLARKAYNGKGITQKETALLIGISESMYRAVENGAREGRGRMWDALETLFGIPQRQLRGAYPAGREGMCENAKN